MKRILIVFLALSMLLCACGTPSDDAVSNDVSVEDTSSTESIAEESTPSEETSSEFEEEAGPVFKEIDGIKYYDVMASGAKDAVILKDPFTGVTQGNHSKYFPEDVEGYYLDDMLFLVDKDTFSRILSKPVAGTGSIKWTGFDPSANYISNPDKFDGILPVEKMDDPLYVYLCKPADYTADLGRTHSFNMASEAQVHEYILPMAAIHTTDDKPIPDDAEFTICIRGMKLCVYTEKDGWQLVQDLVVPSVPFIYYLPWSLEHTLGRMTLPEDTIQLVDDHYEIKLTGADFHGADKVAEGATGSTLHFWGARYYIPEKFTIQGMAVSYDCWIKEEQWSDYLLATVGVDWKTADGVPGGDQVFTGRAAAITTESQVIFGHNVGPKAYDKIMDTEKVQEFIGLK